MVPFSSTDLCEARTRHRQASAEVVENYTARAPLATDQVTPSQLSEGIERFFSLAARIDRDCGDRGAVIDDDITQVGDYGLQLLSDLTAWAAQLGAEYARYELQLVAVDVAHWVIRHHGELRTPEIVVDALAVVANTTRDIEELKQLEEFMTDAINAMAAPIKRDLEKTNPGRPWRVLHVNRAIVATRTHETNRMVRVFDEFVDALPEEAPAFFTEGMNQIDKVDYPERVRKIIKSYHDLCCPQVMH